MNITPLDHKIEIYVPSTVNVDESHAGLQAKWTDEALTRLATIFGGATFIPGIGAWVSKTKGLVKEPMNIVFANCTADDMNNHKVDILKLALEICRDMAQEAVTVNFNGKMYFVAANNYSDLAEAA